MKHVSRKVGRKRKSFQNKISPVVDVSEVGGGHCQEKVKLMKSQRKKKKNALHLEVTARVLKDVKSQWQTTKAESQLCPPPWIQFQSVHINMSECPLEKKKQLWLGVWPMLSNSLIILLWSGRSGIWPGTFIHTQVAGRFITCYPHSHSFRTLVKLQVRLHACSTGKANTPKERDLAITQQMLLQAVYHLKIPFQKSVLFFLSCLSSPSFPSSPLLPSLSPSSFSHYPFKSSVIFIFPFLLPPLLPSLLPTPVFSFLSLALPPTSQTGSHYVAFLVMGLPVISFKNIYNQEIDVSCLIWKRSRKTSGESILWVIDRKDFSATTTRKRQKGQKSRCILICHSQGNG